jgi:drug/metabolite transporter (DMT)-like permease
MKSVGRIIAGIPAEVGLVGAVLAISTGSIFIRLAQAEAEPMVIAFYRLGIASLVLLPFALRHRGEINRLEKNQWSLLALGGIALALHFATWISSLRFTSVMSSVVFVNTSPLWVAALSPVLLKESISRGAKLGLGLAFLGGLVVAASSSMQIQGGRLVWAGFWAGGVEASRVWLGNFLALAGAWCATAFLLVGRKLRPNLSLVSYTFLLYGSAAVVMLVVVLASGQPLAGYSVQTYIWLAALAFIPQLIGHSLFNWALRFIPAAYVSVVLLGEPVGASLLALIFLKELPGWIEGFGAVIILSGIYIVSRFEHSL